MQHFFTPVPRLMVGKMSVLVIGAVVITILSFGLDWLQTASKLHNQRLAQMMEMIHSHIEWLRYQTSEWLRSTLPHMSSQAILPALLVGDRGYLHTDYWRVFSATGVSHLMAISGLHVGMVWGISYWMIRLVWAAKDAKMPLFVSLMVAGGYGGLAGFSLPTQRALLMLAIITLVSVVRRVVKPFDVWLVSLCLLLLLDSSLIESISFWLSFSAVALLILSASNLRRGTFCQRVLQWVRVQCLLSIGLAPLVLGYFGTVSWISPLVNMIAVPLITLVVLPLLLLLFCLYWMLMNPSIDLFKDPGSGIVESLNLALQWGLDIMLATLSVVVDLSWQAIYWLASSYSTTVSMPPMSKMHLLGLLYCPCYMLTLSLMLPRPLPGRWALVVGGIPLFFTLFGLNSKS